MCVDPAVLLEGAEAAADVAGAVIRPFFRARSPWTPRTTAAR